MCRMCPKEKIVVLGESSGLYDGKMSLWNSVVTMVCGRLVLASSDDVPMWNNVEVCRCGTSGMRAASGATY